MALNIKNSAVEELAEEVARLAGETKTEAIRRALAEQPHDPQAHALLGLCLAKQEKLPEAQAEVEQAITLAPDWDHAHYCRSVVLQERRRYADAEAAARGWPSLHAELRRIDPATAARLAPADAQRIQRALEVWRLSGRPLSSWHRCGPRDG